MNQAEEGNDLSIYVTIYDRYIDVIDMTLYAVNVFGVGNDVFRLAVAISFHSFNHLTSPRKAARVL